LTEKPRIINKYMSMSREQNAGQYHNINIGDKSFEREGNFKYLGIILKFQIAFMNKPTAD